MAQHPTANFVVQALLESAPRCIRPISPLYLPCISVQALLESAPSAEPFARCMGA